MRFGIFLAPFEDFAEPRRVLDLAVAAEEAGWDGLFLWDHMLSGPGTPVAEAWITMAGIATVTSTIRLGALVTPLPRRRPWVLAREIATLDRLSGGRLVVGVGMGDDGWREFSSFDEPLEARTRGRLLDEGLGVIRELLQARPLQHRGEAYSVDTSAFLPAPCQQPVPFWAAGRWPRRAPLARAARLEGFFPIFSKNGEFAAPEPDQMAEIRRRLDELGAAPGHDLVVTWELFRERPARRAARIRAAQEAGATWVLEMLKPGAAVPAAQLEGIVRQGPPHG